MFSAFICRQQNNDQINTKLTATKSEITIKCTRLRKDTNDLEVTKETWHRYDAESPEKTGKECSPTQCFVYRKKRMKWKHERKNKLPV